MIERSKKTKKEITFFVQIHFFHMDEPVLDCTSRIKKNSMPTKIIEEIVEKIQIILMTLLSCTNSWMLEK